MHFCCILAGKMRMSGWELSGDALNSGGPMMLLMAQEYISGKSRIITAGPGKQKRMFEQKLDS